MMQTPDTLTDRYLDLKSLSAYASMGVSLLRYHIKESGLPHYAVHGGEKGGVSKILVKRSEFDEWMQRRWKRQGRDETNIDALVDDILNDLKSDTQSVGQAPENGSSVRIKSRRRR